MATAPVDPGDDSLILQLLDLVAVRLRQLLANGIVAENDETIHQTQREIDRLQLQLQRLRVVLRQRKLQQSNRPKQNRG